jgi:CHAD domain-containing protein
MAVTITLPTGGTAKSIGLEVWMKQVLERVEKIEPQWDSEDIHDLRTALRRSRTMAEALSEVNPAPEWRKVKKATRGLFHALGDLRDAQVARSWIRKLGPVGDPLREHMLRLLWQQERKQRRLVETALEDFDRKNWRKWKRRLAPKARFFPLESVVFQRLALARLNEAVDLYQQARKKRSSKAWHRLRIGIKRFRYVVENFLPQRYEIWGDELKRMQDLLGEVHDFDLLRTSVRAQSSGRGQVIVAKWLARIEAERRKRLGEFLARTSREDSPWVVWRAGFQWGHVLVAVSLPERRTA